ncbi:universal stress protein [Halorubrum laminariae]|uniref:Universal stress protein n=1 Tax=Halorubrum laminariae TaxID=1433523 RepID=A0ABD6C295_9EURY|nr:universal stress protein [Halorubrum laminariae]
MYKILAAIDESEQRTRNSISAIQSLPRDGESIHVSLINIFEEFDISDDSGGRVKSADLVDKYDPPETMELAEKLLNESNISHSSTLRHGKPAAKIIEAAGDEEVDMIVVASGDQSPVGKVLFGSVTQGVLIDSDWPVLVV